MFELMWTDRAEEHVARHNVNPHEVEEATDAPFHTYPGKGDATVLLGRTYSGRYLKVILSEAADGRYFVCTAFDMSKAEKREYQKKVSNHER